MNLGFMSLPPVVEICSKCTHPMDEHFEKMCRHFDGRLYCKCYRPTTDSGPRPTPGEGVESAASGGSTPPTEPSTGL